MSIEGWQYLQKVGIFADLQPADLRDLAGRMQTREYPTGSVSVGQEDRGDSMFVVTQGQTIPMMALDKTSFRPLEFEGISITFNVEGGNVTGVAFKQGTSTTQMKRVVEAKP